MKKLQDQLKAIAKNLASLSKQVDKISKQAAKPAPKKAAPAKKKPVVKKTKRAKAAPAVAAETTATAKAMGGTVLDTVFDVIKRSRNGATIANLREKTGLEARQLSNALYKLAKKGRVKTKSRGVYIKV
jgi:predicted Rossmann fold nucleotide-binding protein DprA/Smf involved in DNA uptake